MTEGEAVSPNEAFFQEVRNLSFENKEALRFVNLMPKVDVAVACGKGWMVNPRNERVRYFDGIFNEPSVLAPEARDTALAAAILFQAAKADRIICCGGRTGGNEGMSESLAMKYFIREMFPDINPKKVELDENSYDTTDNADFSKEKISQSKDSAAVLTVTYHAPRTKMVFERSWNKTALTYKDVTSGQYAEGLPPNNFVMVESDTLVNNVLPNSKLVHQYRQPSLSSQIIESIREPVTRWLYSNEKLAAYIRMKAKSVRST